MAQSYGVIMAGGSGTRFWPLSRAAHPKQLLNLTDSEESLIQATYRRLASVIPAANIRVVTGTRLAPQIASALPQLAEAQILAEPVGRNTAPCVGWAATQIARQDPEAVVVVVPADHHIGDEAGYRQVLERSIAAAMEGDMVTVGIEPTRPETGYGYVEVGDRIADGVFRARRFVEKPNEQRAQQFLAAGRFLWNSGMFFFRADRILQAIREHLPGLGEALERYDEAAKRGEERAAVESSYGTLPDISIDHGVMEKAGQVSVVPGNFGWSDVGSWTSAWELSSQDSDQNALDGAAVLVDSAGCYVRSSGEKLIALVGVRDLVVVDTPEALLVVPRSRAQDVKQAVTLLKRQGKDRYL